MGSSETVSAEQGFTTVDPKWKVFQSKREAAFYPAWRMPPRTTRRFRADSFASGQVGGNIGELVGATLLREHTPACAVVNKRGDILYIHGRTGRYFEPAAGVMSLNIVQMAREGLKAEISAAIREAVAQRTPVYCRGLRVKGDESTIWVDLTVAPFPEGHPNSGDMLMVLFKETGLVRPDERISEAASAAAEIAATVEPAADQRVANLERELQDRDEYLRTVIEELESANEELQSTIEEYHSTNEELETSREELQSVNEELMTVNAELQTKNVDLSRASSDISNVLIGTGIGLIFVDLQLCITRFTPNATRIVNLIHRDVGRPVGHITSRLVGYSRLEEDVQDVLDTLVPKEVELCTRDSEWYRMRIVPYRTLDHVIAGAVIVFVSITEIKKLQTLSRLAVVVRDSYDAITVQDLLGRILAWNPGAERLYGWTESEALDMNIRDVVPEDRRGEALAMIKKLAEGDRLEPFLTERLTKDGGRMAVWMMATILLDEDGMPYAVATTERRAKPEERKHRPAE